MVETRVAQYKKDIVTRFEKLLLDYPIIGAVNLESLPSAQLANMRKSLRGKVELIMTKRRLMKIAIEKIKDKKSGIEQLEEKLVGMPALLFTKENPFSLFKLIKKNKSKAPAKAGQVLPSDVKIPAGITSFTPGPMISELGAFGIKTKVTDGKLEIIDDVTVAKEGDVIDEKLSGLLAKFGIEPMEIGLDLVAVYENGTIFGKDVLDIDEEEFWNKLCSAATYAVNLAVETGYPTKDTMELVIGKAYRDSKGLAIEQNILADEVVEEILIKSQRQMTSVAGKANYEYDISTSKPTESSEVPAEQKEESATSESEAKEEKTETTEEKVEKMVEEVKKESNKEEVSAENLVEEAKEEAEEVGEELETASKEE